MKFFNTDAACPYCYHTIALKSVGFRCSERHAPGREACGKQPDPVQEEYLDNARPVYPTFATPYSSFDTGQRADCPGCGGSTGVRVCSVCHSVLPSTFGGEKAPMFGMVGVKGSGKTVYLTVLVHELTTSVRRRFGGSINTVGESPMIEKVKEFRESIETGGLLPDQTQAAAVDKRYPIILEWRQEKRGIAGQNQLSSTILSFYDTAGEDLQTQDATSSLAYLGAASGLIVIMDPFQFPENRERGRMRGVGRDALSTAPIEVIGRITELLRAADAVKSKRRIKRPLAVVLAKIDAFFDEVGSDDPIRRPAPNIPAFDEAESEDLHNHVEALIEQWGGEDVLAHLRMNYQKYRFFACSSLGAEPDYSEARADSQGLRPHRVAEPLLWLMANEKLIVKQG